MNDMPDSPRQANLGETVIEAEGVSKVYWDGYRKLNVLTDIELKIVEGETVAILGPSGSGKTTLLNVLSGLDKPSSGRVKLAGAPLESLDEGALARLRNAEVGLVFQFYHLLSELTALENVMLPLLLRRASQPKEVRRRAEALLGRVGLARRTSHFPTELSGGEQQRVAIARALVHDPRILFCDEPTGNLDPATAAGVAELLREFFKEKPRAVLMVTHDERIAKMADRVLKMENINKLAGNAG